MVTLFNLTNLTIGFTTFVLIETVVSYEYSYDKSNVNYERIYRVQTKQEESYPINYCSFSPSAIRYHVLADLPEVEQVLLMREISGGQGGGQYFTLAGGQQLYVKNGYWSENSVFDVFTFNLIEGNKSNALTDPNSIVLSETLAKKLFRNEKAIGKKVIIEKKYPLTVTAVYKDLPLNTTTRPTYLISLDTYINRFALKDYRNDWTAIDNDNFVLLKKGTDPIMVDEKIKDAFKDIKEFEKTSLYLYPLSKHHILPNNQNDLIVALSILSLAGILILVLSCINYVNLSIANSSGRACEIGIKKIVGFSKKIITLQFMTETLLLTLFAIFIGLIAAQSLMPVMAKILMKDFVYNVFINKSLLIKVMIVGIFTGLITGIYPSFVLSSFSPVKVLKGKLLTGNAKYFNLRKVLIATQFTISLIMLIVSFILYNHVNFILNKNLGFNHKNIIFSEITTSKNVDFETLKERLLQYPEIVDASFSSTIPFQGNFGGFVAWQDGSPDQKEMISRNYVNYDFIPTYGLKLIIGRNFSPQYPSDYSSCVINETALKAFGWTDPIGKQIYLNDRSYTVIGVVKDFHPFSVHNRIPNYMMFLSKNELSGTKLLTVRYTSGNEQKVQELVTHELENILPNDPFEFKSFDVIYYLDFAISFWQSMKRLFLFFSIITIIVSTIGLFGLILYTTKRRTKEIGVRKVLGSSVISIYEQLAKEILELIGFAILIACPVAWYIYLIMPGAYKEPLTVSEFVFSILVVLFVALITISYHIIKLATRNPVEALRYE